jgi:hypothetical protein
MKRTVAYTCGNQAENPALIRRPNLGFGLRQVGASRGITGVVRHLTHFGETAEKDAKLIAGDASGPWLATLPINDF